MSEVATPPRRLGFWAVPAIGLLAAAGAGWYGWLWFTTPAPPNIPLEGLDPDVAAAIRSKVDDVRKNGRSAAA